MRKTKRATFIFIAFLSLFPACAAAFDDNDIQLWTGFSTSGELREHLKANVEEELRFEDDASRLYYAHTDLRLLYSPTRQLKDLGLTEDSTFYAGMGFKLVEERKPDDWKTENRPYLEFDYRWKFKSLFQGIWMPVVFQNRVLLEYRAREGADDYWRGRDKLTAILPFKFTRFEMQPYVAVEGFYDIIDNNNFFRPSMQYQSRVRFYEGITMKASEQFDADICFIEQETKENEGTKTQTILQFKIKYIY